MQQKWNVIKQQERLILFTCSVFSFESRWGLGWFGIKIIFLLRIVSDFNQLIRIQDWDSGKSPLKDKPIYLVLYQPFGHSCLDYYESSSNHLIWKKARNIKIKIRFLSLHSNEFCFNIYAFSNSAISSFIESVLYL